MSSDHSPTSGSTLGRSSGRTVVRNLLYSLMELSDVLPLPFPRSMIVGHELGLSPLAPVACLHAEMVAASTTPSTTRMVTVSLGILVLTATTRSIGRIRMCREAQSPGTILLVTLGSRQRGAHSVFVCAPPLNLVILFYNL